MNAQPSTQNFSIFTATQNSKWKVQTKLLPSQHRCPERNKTPGEIQCWLARTKNLFDTLYSIISLDDVWNTSTRSCQSAIGWPLSLSRSTLRAAPVSQHLSNQCQLVSSVCHYAWPIIKSRKNKSGITVHRSFPLLCRTHEGSQERHPPRCRRKKPERRIRQWYRSYCNVTCCSFTRQNNSVF